MSHAETNHGCWNVPIGKSIVHFGENDENGPLISADWFNLILGWYQVGLIEVSSPQAADLDRIHTWEDWEKKFKDGKLEIDVKMTDEGRKVDQAAPALQRDKNTAYCQMFDNKTNKINATRHEVIGKDLYCIIDFEEQEKLTDIGEKIFKANGRPIPKKQIIRVKWLLKHHNEGEPWEIFATDWASGDNAFDTNEVESALKMLKQADKFAP